MSINCANENSSKKAFASWSNHGTKSLMPISHLYNPLQTFANVGSDFSSFSFLETPSGDYIYKSGHINSIPLLPLKMGVPWLSAIPACRQSKHWKICEDMAKELLDTIYRSSSQSRGKLPIELKDTSGDIRSHKEREILATSVKSTTYMFPDASPIRAGMIAQSMLLIFLHDDVVEPSPSDAGRTITDEIMASWSEIYDGELESPIEALEGFSKSVIKESSVLGKDLLAGAFKWVKHTKEYRSIPSTVFGTLRSYLDYRSNDIGLELLLAQASFSCDVSLTQIERTKLDKFICLFADHISLTNDLYSFRKEEEDHQKTGALLVNAIDVIRKIHAVSTPAAKQIAMFLILDVELQFHQEFTILIQSTQLNSGQKKYAMALVKCVAGHIFYSVTSGRYGGSKAVVPVAMRNDRSALGSAWRQMKHFSNRYLRTSRVA